MPNVLKKVEFLDVKIFTVQLSEEEIKLLIDSVDELSTIYDQESDIHTMLDRLYWFFYEVIDD